MHSRHSNLISRLIFQLEDYNRINPRTHVASDQEHSFQPGEVDKIDSQVGQTRRFFIHEIDKWTCVAMI